MSFAVAQYKSTTVQTASPLQLLVQLYDGAIRFLRAAAAAIGEGNVAQRGAALGKAHAIVTELAATLDNQHAPELCAELERLYEFVIHQITQANVRSDARYLTPAINVLLELRAAWAQLAKEQE